VAHHPLTGYLVALLVGLVAPVFAAASWLTEQRRARSARKPHPPAHPHPTR
jgi:hypothetical protein